MSPSPYPKLSMRLLQSRQRIILQCLRSISIVEVSMMYSLIVYHLPTAIRAVWRESLRCPCQHFATFRLPSVSRLISFPTTRSLRSCVPRVHGLFDGEGNSGD